MANFSAARQQTSVQETVGQSGGLAHHIARIEEVIEACELDAVDPQACLAATLTDIANDHKQSRIVELLPWNFTGKGDMTTTDRGKEVG